ncbi:multiple cyclophane-containing RiPP AmcA [Streptomyces alkaliphilus]|uniref:multiple cyclophane-containing RiPP AmcA n=1 Tax=Streptomyces alkaliphilus TaxID=1472722 RepID=UPI0012961CFA
MTLLELLALADTPTISHLTGHGRPDTTVNMFNNQPTWDNAGGNAFDNRPTWDNWNKKQ